MQRTRLSTLLEATVNRLGQWVFNPWRRLSLIIIGLLSGNFFAIAVSATTGQQAKLDITISGILVLLVEVVSWLYYRRTRSTGVGQAFQTTERSLGLEVLNAFKLGLVYGLFVEAFKLGS